LVLNNSVALTKWTQLVDQLIPLAADVDTIKAKLRGQDPSYAEAVLSTPEIWNAHGDRKRADFLAALENCGLHSLAGERDPFLLEWYFGVTRFVSLFRKYSTIFSPEWEKPRK
jgi:hypothetical protein